MPDTIAEIIRAGYEETFAGKPARLMGMISDDYRHYGADDHGVYREFTADELTSMMADVATRAEATNEVVDTQAIGDEIVLVTLRGSRRSRVSDAAAEFRWATLVNIVNGRILRTVEIAEQSVLEFWRKMAPPT